MKIRAVTELTMPKRYPIAVVSVTNTAAHKIRFVSCAVQAFDNSADLVRDPDHKVTSSCSGAFSTRSVKSVMIFLYRSKSTTQLCPCPAPGKV